MQRSIGSGRRTAWVLAGCLMAASLVFVACGDDDGGGGGGAAGGGGENYKVTLIAGVKGDEFYITMNCGAQEEAKKQGVTLDFQGPDQFDASLQTPIVNAVDRQEARRDPDRADGRQGDVRPDQAGGRRRHQDRARRHHARAGRLRGLPDRVRQRRWRQGRRQGAGRGDRRQRQGVRQQRQAGDLDHRPARAGLRGRGQEPRARVRRHGVQPGPARQGGRDHQGASSPSTRT